MREGFNIESNDNALFVTEQCNNNCLMCCQPPKKEDDIEVLYQKNIQLLHSAPKELKVLGITGGEPTLLGEKLVDLLTEARNCLPYTAFQLLSNGRGFMDAEYTHRVAQAAGEDFFVGIPLPGTGAWTGTLGASILDMKFKPTVLAAMGGVILAGLIISGLGMLGFSFVGA